MKKNKRLTPVMELLINDSDTEQIINKAFEIADLHPYYVGDNSPASMATFITESEKGPKVIAIRVEPGTTYEVNRFKAALKQARKQPVV